MLAVLKNMIVASVSPQRKALFEAIAKRAEAEQTLADAKERVARAQAIIDAADDFELAVMRANRAAEDAARDWAASGQTDGRREHYQALEEARAARVQADDANVAAKGASAAIGGLKNVQQNAKYALERAQSAVQAAAAEVIYAELQPAVLDRLQRIADSIPRIVADIYGLRSLERMLYAHSSGGGRSDSLLNEFEPLERCISGEFETTIPVWEMIEKLRADPNASISET